MYEERVVIIDRVLQTTRVVYVREKEMKKRFPISVRSLRDTISKEVGDFSLLVRHEIKIDLTQFNLPGSVKDVTFDFVNPLWAWITAANDMVDAGHTMHFEPKAMFHETTQERLYGAGVSFGDKLKFAASRTPPGGKPALFGISFDGGDSGVSNRTVYPICVSVLDCDGADPLSCGLVGFIPVINVPTNFKKKSPKFLLARAHVTQKCIGAILDELENVSRHGFTGVVGGEMSRFHPFLVAVRVDSKERTSYFGMRSDRYIHEYTYMNTHILTLIYEQPYMNTHI